MTQSAVQVTIATSSGALWLALMIHYGAGVLGLGAGFVAITVAKGGPTHRRAGIIFVGAMITLGVFGAGIALFERKYDSLIAGLFTAYLVFTALTTVRPPGGHRERVVNIAATLVGSGVALVQFPAMLDGLSKPTQVVNGVPAGMSAFFGVVALLAAIGDWRLLAAGSITGSRRLARHLWRVCFALFVASGSFFLGQMRFLPESLRVIPLLLVLSLFPLVALLYWMWRVQLSGRLQGMILRQGAS